MQRRHHALALRAGHDAPAVEAECASQPDMGRHGADGAAPTGRDGRTGLWTVAAMTLAYLVACGGDTAPATIDLDASGADLDTTNDTSIDTRPDLTGKCWADETVCLLDCPDGQHCVVPGICVPLEDPGPLAAPFADPRQRSDRRTMLSPDGEFVGPIGVIDDARFPATPVGVSIYLTVTSILFDANWDFDYGPLTKVRTAYFEDWILGDLRVAPGREEPVDEQDVAGLTSSAWGSGLMGWVRSGTVPPMVIEQARESPPLYRLWAAQFVLEGGRNLRATLDQAEELPVPVRPVLDAAGDPVLLAEWSFASDDAAFSEPAPAVVIAHHSTVLHRSDRYNSERAQLPGTHVSLPFHASQINRNLVVRNGALVSINRDVPVEPQAYLIQGEPALPVWRDGTTGFLQAPVGTFILSGLLPVREFLYYEQWPSGSCTCMRPPDTVEIDDDLLHVTATWDRSNGDPYANCTTDEERGRCATEELRERTTRHFGFDGIYSQSSIDGIGHWIGCDPLDHYLPFIRLTRVAPAVSRPALGWERRTPPPDAEGSSSNIPAPAPDGE